MLCDGVHMDDGVVSFSSKKTYLVVLILYCKPELNTYMSFDNVKINKKNLTPKFPLCYIMVGPIEISLCLSTSLILSTDWSC